MIIYVVCSKLLILTNCLPELRELKVKLYKYLKTCNIWITWCINIQRWSSRMMTVIRNPGYRKRQFKRPGPNKRPCPNKRSSYQLYILLLQRNYFFMKGKAKTTLVYLSVTFTTPQSFNFISKWEYVSTSHILIKHTCLINHPVQISAHPRCLFFK